MATRHLEGVGVGDRITVGDREILTVERVTPTRVVAGKRQWRIDDGREHGGLWCARPWKPGDEERVARYEADKRVQRAQAARAQAARAVEYWQMRAHDVAAALARAEATLAEATAAHEAEQAALAAMPEVAP